MPAGTKIVQIDINPVGDRQERQPRSRVSRRPQGRARGAGRPGAPQAAPRSRPRVAAERAEKIGERTKAARARYWEQAKKNWDATPISAPRLMHEIRHALPDDALVFAEAITNSAHLTQALMPDEPGRLVRVRGGGIGPGPARQPRRPAGAARSQGRGHLLGRRGDVLDLGACGRPPTIKIPVTYVMLNNAAYRILKLNMVEYLGKAARGRKFIAMDLTDPELRFDRMAESMGVPGVPRRASPDDLAPDS